VISCDTETTGLDKNHGSRPYFVTITNEQHQTKFWEADVHPFTRIPDWSQQDIQEIKYSLWDPIMLERQQIVFHNAKFDISMLESLDPEIGENWPWDMTHETLYSGHLLNSNLLLNLTTQVTYYLDFNIKPYEIKLKEAVTAARRLCRTKAFIERHGQWRLATEGDPMMPSVKGSAKKKSKSKLGDADEDESSWQADMWLPRTVAKYEKYPSDHLWWTVLSDYSNVDSGCTLPLHKQHKRMLEDRGLWAIYLERLKMLPIIYDMEHRGLSMSLDRMQELEQQFEEISKLAGKTCVDVAENYGYGLELPKNGMNKSLTEVCFNKDGLNLLSFPSAEEHPKTEKGQPSLNKFALEHYLIATESSLDHQSFLKSIQKKRGADTALSYRNSYRAYMLKIEEPDWYQLYPSLNPTGTGTLRWTSRGPNEQQISKKEDFNLRYIFGPRPGYEWWSLDYDNLELRIPAYEAGERVMIDIFEKPEEAPYFGSYHLLNASIVYPDLFWPLADEKGAFKKKYADTWYQWIKNFGFAVGYGAIESSGTADQAAHKPGAQRMVQDRLKELAKLNKHQIQLANKQGYVETIPDREVDPHKGYPLTCPRGRYGQISPTIPLNYHVQGTACWVVMRAMFKIQTYFTKHCPQARIVMNIHDEVMLEFPYVENEGNRPHLEKIRGIMGGVGQCIGVNLTCGLNYHPICWSQSA